MTSSLHRRTRLGFTLIELLVVIGMIALIAAISVPMIARAHRIAIHNAMAADLAVIASALDAYKADFGDYPRRTVTTVNGKPLSGAALLCWALIAPGPATEDGADGPGFRVRGQTGAVKGPYLPTDRFTVGPYQVHLVTPSTNNIDADVTNMLGDRNYKPILYYAANKKIDPYTPAPGGAYIGDVNAVFNYDDNAILQLKTQPDMLSKSVMRFRLGAIGKPPTVSAPDGNLYAPQVPAANGPFLLWMSGPDSYFGNEDDVANSGGDIQLNTTSLPFDPYNPAYP